MVPFVTVRIVASLISTLPPVWIVGLRSSSSSVATSTNGGDAGLVVPALLSEFAYFQRASFSGFRASQRAYFQPWTSGPAYVRGLDFWPAYSAGFAFSTGLLSVLDFWSGCSRAWLRLPACGLAFSTTPCSLRSRAIRRRTAF